MEKFKIAILVLVCCLHTAITFAEMQTADEEPNQPDYAKLIPSDKVKKYLDEGTWSGYLEALNIKYMIILRMRQNLGRTLTATLYCPDISAKDMPVENVTFANEKLQFEIKDLVASFEGKLNDDGSAIEGHWKQSGFVFPLTVKRISETELNMLLEDELYTKVFSPNELKVDLDYLLKTIEDVHPNMYAYISKEDFAKLRHRVYRDINKPMTRLDFYKMVAPLVASLETSHTNVQPLYRAYAEYVRKGGRVFPFGLHWDGTRVMLKSCISSHEIPIGSEVLSIDGQDAKGFIISTTKYCSSDNKSYNLRLLDDERTFRFLMYLAKGNVEFIKISVKTMDGDIKEYIVKALNLKEIESQALVHEVEHTALASDKNPNYSYRYIPGYNTGLIDFNLCVDLEKFKVFLVETFNKIKEQSPSNLIIDIRKNPGGTLSLGDEFLKYLTDKSFRQFEKIELKVSKQVCAFYKKWLKENLNAKIGSIKSVEGGFVQPVKNPLRFKGKVFLLISRSTASSAMNFAAAVKHFSIATLVGQETEDTPVCYGDTFMDYLPNTRMGFSVSYKRFVGVGAMDNSRGVIPDYEVKQKSEDIAKGVDTVLQFTLDLIKKSSSEIPSEQEADNQGRTKK